MSQIEVKNLVYTYGKGTPFVNHAVNDVSFKADGGEIIGVIGHTGSGKSTVVQHLNGLLKPESGEILLNGKNIWTDFEKISDIRFRSVLFFSILNINFLKKPLRQILPLVQRIWD